MALQCGIVGLPNVGKSTLFNCLSNAKAQAANFPFCTIEPNVGVITVPDRRLIRLAEIDNPKRVVPTTIEIVDIAGLVKGASKGEGLGNKFLGNIRNTNAIIHVLRCFDNGNITHVDGSIDPVRDKGIIDTELQLKDLETVENRLSKTQKQATSGGDKQAKRAALAVQGGAGTGAFGPHRGTRQGGPQTGRRPQPADRQARVVRLQRRRKERRDGQRLHRGRPGGHRRRAGRNARHRRRHGGRHRRTGRLRRAADVPRRPGAGGVGRGAPDQIGLQIAQPRNVLHHRGRRDPRLDLPARHESPADGRHHPHRFRKGSEKACRDAGKLSIEGKEYVVEDGDIMHFLFNV